MVSSLLCDSKMPRLTCVMEFLERLVSSHSSLSVQKHRGVLKIVAYQDGRELCVRCSCAAYCFVSVTRWAPVAVRAPGPYSRLQSGHSQPWTTDP